MEAVGSSELGSEGLPRLFEGGFRFENGRGDFGERTVAGFLGGEASATKDGGEIIGEDRPEGFLLKALHPTGDPLQSLLQFRLVGKAPRCGGDGILEPIGEAAFPELVDEGEKTGRADPLLRFGGEIPDQGGSEIRAAEKTKGSLEGARRDQGRGLVEEVIDAVSRNRLPGGIIGGPPSA